MLKYNDLSNAQKKLVDTFVEYHPELASAETITSKQMHTIWHEIFNNREAGAPKLGYPHWLSKNNQVSRGVLAFPGPETKGLTEQEKADYEKSEIQSIVDDVEVTVKPVSGYTEDEFLDELRANGINV